MLTRISHDANQSSYIVDTEGYDEIYFSHSLGNVRLDQATFERSMNYDLRIQNLTSGSSAVYDLYIANQFLELEDNDGAGIEMIKFKTSG